MSTKSDPQLLREYSGSRSEAAFAELLRRHLDLVHSAALRITGDAHLAKDVSQGVFVALAKDAGKLAAHPVLSGWLHATTRNIAAQAIRTETRRRKREQQAAAMHDPSETAAAWDGIAPHLDAALAELPGSDRDAVLLRYFENQSARDMAAVLGISPEAAQKRVNRGVEKLREKLAKRGITAGAAGLTSAISAHAVQAAPAGLAALVSSAAMVTTTSATVAATTIFAMSTIQKALAIAAIVVVGAIAIHQTRQAAQLRQEVRNIQHLQDSPPTPSLSKNPIQNPTGLARNSERVVRKNNELEKQNAALKEEKIRAEEMLEINRQQNDWMGRVTEKVLMDKELQGPQTASEFAEFYGQVKLRSRNFYEKWNGKLPPAGSPEDAIYQKELASNIADDAALMKALATLGEELFRDSASMVRFQSTQLSNALELEESQLSQLNETLSRFYADAKHRNLTWKSLPASGEYPALEAQKNPDSELAAWFKKRDEISEKAYAEIQTYLTPQQRTDFRRIYNSGFLWGANIGSHLPSAEAR